MSAASGYCIASLRSSNSVPKRRARWFPVQGDWRSTGRRRKPNIRHPLPEVRSHEDLNNLYQVVRVQEPHPVRAWPSDSREPACRASVRAHTPSATWRSNRLESFNMFLVAWYALQSDARGASIFRSAPCAARPDLPPGASVAGTQQVAILGCIRALAGQEAQVCRHSSVCPPTGSVSHALLQWTCAELRRIRSESGAW